MDRGKKNKTGRKTKDGRPFLDPLSAKDALKKMIGVRAVEVGKARTQKTRKNMNGRRS
jgi:hypothetical protein